jgi:hypothetical protein
MELIMPNPISTLRRFLDHQWGVTLFALVLLLCSTFVHSQSTPVVLAPLPQLQFFDQTGTPLAFGCVFTYQVATTTPLGTYTDYTGTTLNPNPVPLSAGGSANIWLIAGQAYTFRVASAGGTNCASGSTLYTVNGIGGGSTTLTTVVPYSATPAFQVAAQNQLFEITLTGNASAQPLTFVGITPPSYITFQITEDSSGSHTWSWPANSVGGCTIGPGANQVTTQQFVYNGTNATAIGPCVTATGPTLSAGNIFDYGLTASAGVCVNSAFLLISGSGCSSFLNITINGQTCAPGGTCNVNASAAAHSIALNEGNGNAITGLLLGNNAIAVGQTSADPVGSTIPTCVTGVTHLSFSGALPLTCQPDISILVQHTTTLASPVSISSDTATSWISQAITMPSTGCPCRVFASYEAYFSQTNSGADVAWINDGTVIFDTVQTANTGSTNNYGVGGAAYSTATYVNSAAVTFTGYFFTNSSGGGTVTTNTVDTGVTGQQASWLNLVVVTSN